MLKRESRKHQNYGIQRTNLTTDDGRGSRMMTLEANDSDGMLSALIYKIQMNRARQQRMKEAERQKERFKNDKSKNVTKKRKID